MSKHKLKKNEIPNPWIAFSFWLDDHPICKRVYCFLRLKTVRLMKRLEHILAYGVKHSPRLRHWHAYIQKKRQEHEDILVFLKAWAKNPLLVGAIAPSSHRLAQEMASHCNFNHPGIVVELGAGTGVVTAALLKAGLNDERLIIVEYSSAMVNKLRQNFPQVRIIEGNAANLIVLLKDEQRPIASIVSSLPLRSLPTSFTEVFLQQITSLLPPQSKYIQYTYSFKKNNYPALSHYRQICSKRIWLNIPPARVDVWQA